MIIEESPPTLTHNSTTSPEFPQRKSKIRTALSALIILVALVIVAIAVGYYLLSHATNTWTGRGNNDEWSNASNWSLGRPINGQTLSINFYNVNPKYYTFVPAAGPPGAGVDDTLYDNIPNLSVRNIIFTSSSSTALKPLHGISMLIGGDTLHVSGQIVDSTTTNASSVSFNNNVALTGKVSVENQDSVSGLDFYGTTVIAKESSIYFQTGRNKPATNISFGGPLSGSGSMYLNSYANVSFLTSSPKLSGNTTISYGAVLHLGESSQNSSGILSPSSVDGLGSSSIHILKGGNLELDAAGEGDYGGAGSDSFKVSNNITMSGSGTVYTPRSDLGNLNNTTGALTGAVNNCMAAGQDGCSGYLANHGMNTVTFTGQITLASNTQLGSITENSENATPGFYSYTTYIFNKPLNSGNAYILTPVSDSKVAIGYNK